MGDDVSLKRCFREPIPEIFDSAHYLDAAVSAHLAGQASIAAELFALANNSNVRAWVESVWGKCSPYVTIRKLPPLDVACRVQGRMPTKAQIQQLHERDGFTCRFCTIPVIRAEIRRYAALLYPTEVSWGRTNASQHAGFQALWAQYDHVVPYSCGGTNELDNLVVTCSACNFGKMSYRLEELGLSDPREFPPLRSSWDGLERLLASAPDNSKRTREKLRAA